MRDFKGQHVSLLKSPCHDHQIVPIRWVGHGFFVSEKLADIPVEKAKKLATVGTSQLANRSASRGRQPVLLRHRRDDRIKSVDDRFWRKAVVEVWMLDLASSRWLDLVQTS